MHGAKLSREAIVAGGSHWRLHLWVMCSTFIVFPVLGVLFAWWAPVNVDPALYTGFIYLCILPATVQSAIAFTSGGRQRGGCGMLGFGLKPAGDLHFATAGRPVDEPARCGGESGAGWQNHAAAAAAVCAGTSLSSVDWQLGGKTKKWISKTDQTSILLVVYSAFSEAVVNGIWHKVGVGSLLFIVIVSMVLLAIVIAINVFVARRCGFNKADEITIVFAGRKEPGERHSDGQYSLPDLYPGDNGSAADDLPSDSAYGLCGAGAAL